MSEREWDKLTNLVLDGCVVPVVGPEVLVSDNGRDNKPLYTVWGEALASQAGFDVPDGAPTPTLYEVTNTLSQSQNPNELAYDIDDIVRRRAWAVPEALRKLAEISSFSLYVTTTIDHLLKSAIQEVRLERNGPVEDIIFTPRGVKSRIDLPANFGYSRCVGLFHLFGATGPVDGSFAKTEDDLIEYSWSLLDQQYAPEQLYDYLKKKTVLLLGCSFPDWLGRFFIHALHAGRHDENINIYYVSPHIEAGLADYLRRRRAKVLTDQSPVVFVDELHRRWKSRFQPGKTVAASADSPPPFKTGAVFLSYAREDRGTVLRIRDQLEAANIDTWMDERALEPGEEFQQTIRDHIRNSSFFIAVISCSLDRPGSQSRFLWKEWKWAEDASLERRKEDHFLQPVAVDDTPATAPFVDPPFRDLHWTRVQDGWLSPDFMEYLSRGIRRYRRSR